jgi:hypothetical protein
MRMSPRRRRRSGSIETVKIELWNGIRAGLSILENPETEVEYRLRALSVISGAMAVYLKALEHAGTEKRLSDLEKLVQSTIEQSANGYAARES